LAERGISKSETAKNGLELRDGLGENEREDDHVKGGLEMRRSWSLGQAAKNAKNLILLALSEVVYLFCIYAGFLKMAMP
jgi:hypothetical protein